MVKQVEPEETAEDLNKENEKTENGSTSAPKSPRPQRIHQNKLMTLKHYFNPTYLEFKRIQKEKKLKKLSLVDGFKEHPDYIKASAMFEKEDEEVREQTKAWEERHPEDAAERRRKTNEKRAAARKEAKDKQRAEEEANLNAKHDGGDHHFESRKRGYSLAFDREIINYRNKFVRQLRDRIDDEADDFVQNLLNSIAERE